MFGESIEMAVLYKDGATSHGHQHGHCIVGLSIYGKPKDLCLLRSQNQKKGGRNGNAAKSCGLPMFSDKGSIADPNTTNHVSTKVLPKLRRLFCWFTS